MWAGENVSQRGESLRPLIVSVGRPAKLAYLGVVRVLQAMLKIPEY